jgi:hypothetical protein
MRLRTIILRSLESIMSAGLLPDLPLRTRIDAAAEDTGSVWSRRHVEVATFSDLSHPLYAEEESWARAVRVVHAFRAPGTGVGRYVLPSAFGQFRQTIPIDQACEYAACALRGLGFEVRDTRAMDVVIGRLSDRLRVKTLPPFYGNWLMRRTSGTDIWERQLSFELAVQFRCTMNDAADGSRRAIPALEMSLSAPALALMEPLAGSLGPMMERPSVSAFDQLTELLTRNWHPALASRAAPQGGKP